MILGGGWVGSGFGGSPCATALTYQLPTLNYNWQWVGKAEPAFITSPSSPN
ncbi:MAG: hypothetical protein GXX91_06775 [Verrucomicrobiaceae bacterium]|nr:hypothetical protein [Verrucomicrobiaceae bacterium]